MELMGTWNWCETELNQIEHGVSNLIYGIRFSAIRIAFFGLLLQSYNTDKY